MSKMYTLDGKLLIGQPEVRIGDKVFPVDDRTATVKKIIKLTEENKNSQSIEIVEEVAKLALQKAYKEIDFDNMPFRAYTAFIELIMKAVTGSDDEDEDEATKDPAQFSVVK